jgi:hypothetical protein
LSFAWFSRHQFEGIHDPDRVGTLRSLGIDETVFVKANPEHPTSYVIGFVDLERHVILDVI